MACTNSEISCSKAIGTGIIAVAVVITNIASLGLAASATGEINNMVKVGDKVSKGGSKLRKVFIEVVNKFNTIQVLTQFSQ